jgi:methionyl-tRNA synthetase
VAAFGSDGARYVVLREVPFDKDAEVSWDSFVRRRDSEE